MFVRYKQCFFLRDDPHKLPYNGVQNYADFCGRNLEVKHRIRERMLDIAVEGILGISDHEVMTSVTFHE